MDQYIGIDVGGTKIAAGLVENGRVRRLVKRPTGASLGPRHVISAINKTVARLRPHNVKGIGVGVAGLVDHRRGVVIASPNFSKQFRNVALAKQLRAHFHVPVQVDNDANCFALGEARFGVAKKFSHVVGLTIGTGIGGGIVVDGNLYRGKHGSAGEFGHVTIRDGGITCGCGQHGHLEAYASGIAITNHYEAFTRKKMLASDIIKLAARRNEAADQVVSVASQALANGLALIINALNPDVIVIGGGLGRQRRLVEPAITIAKHLLVYRQLSTTPIVHEKLDGTAAILGATALFN